MELTETEIFLIDGLGLFGVERDAIVGILSAMDTEEKQEALIEWMGTHPEVAGQGAKTTSDILRKVAEIYNR